MTDILPNEARTSEPAVFDPAAMFEAAAPMRAAMMMWAGAFTALYMTCAIAMNYAASR